MASGKEHFQLGLLIETRRTAAARLRLAQVCRGSSALYTLVLRLTDPVIVGANGGPAVPMR